MVDLNEEDFKKAFEEWKVKRRRTTLIAMAMYFFQALENFSIITTLLYYLEEMNLPPYWFSVILIAMTVSEGLSSLILGKFTDKYRNVRTMMIIFLVLSIIGNTMYSFPYSVWLLVIGRFLCGILKSMPAIAGGEFRRCYNEEQLDTVLCAYQYAFDVGYILGPTIALIVRINFTFYTWHVDQYSAVGLLLAFFAFIILLATLLFTSDISKEYDTLVKQRPKSMTNGLDLEILSELPKSIELIEDHIGTYPAEETKKDLWTWRDILKADILLVAVCSAMIRFASNMAETVRVYIAISIFHWNLNEVGITRSICLVISQFAIAILILKGVYKGRNNVFFIFVLSLCVAAVAMVLLVFPMETNTTFLWQMIFYSVHSILESFFLFSGFVTGKGLMLSMAPEHSASFIEGFRISCTTIFKILSLITSAFIFIYGSLFLLPITAFMLILISSILLKRDAYI